MEDLRGIIRDAIEAAKECGLWQSLSLKEKESVVRYFYLKEILKDNCMHRDPVNLLGRDGQAA